MRNRIIKDIFGIFFNPVTGPDIHTSNDSMGLTRAYWQNDMLTLFRKDDSYGRLAGHGFFSGPCNTDITMPDRSFFGHSGWHKNKNDFEITHNHFFNKKEDLLPPEDLQCLLQNIKSFEKMHGLCTDSKTHCLLTDRDSMKIQNEYKQYYTREKAERESNPSTETDENQILDLGVTILNSFISTLIDKYLKPFLLDRVSERGISRKNVSVFLEILRSLTITVFTGSPKQALLNTTVVGIFRLFLTKSGIELSMAEIISAGIGNYFTAFRSYASLISPARPSCILIGQTAAYAIIHSLPKLKYEEIQKESDIAEVVPKPTHEKLPDGLSRRNQ